MTVVGVGGRAHPPWITAATSAGTILLLAPTGAPASTWINAGIGAACLTSVYAAIHALAPTGLGVRDVALAVPIGFTAGWHNWQLVLIVPLLAHALASLVLVYRKVRYAVGEPSVAVAQICGGKYRASPSSRLSVPGIAPDGDLCRSTAFVQD